MQVKETRHVAQNGMVYESHTTPEDNVLLCFAGQRHTQGYLFILGTGMRRPQRKHEDRPSGDAVRLAVACCYNGGMFCKEVTGTKYPGYEQKQYSKQHGEPYKKMGAEEYADFMQAAWRHFMADTGFRRRSHEAWVLHDRDPAHKSSTVKSLLKQLHLPAELLPPRSPDLMPLDYGIFGNCKRQARQQSPPQPDWASTAIDFRKRVENAPFEKTIKQFPFRLKACIAAGGQHFESRLSAMQKAWVRDAEIVE
jgi:hypothetical protein